MVSPRNEFANSGFAGRRQSRKMPRPFTPAGAFSWQTSVSADVDEAQAAPGLNVFVAIAADVEGRAAIKMAVTMVVMAVMSTVAMAMVSAVAVTAMPMTMTAMTARRSRGHRGSTEGDSGDDGE